MCDIVTDDCVDFEDSSTLISGMKQKAAPTIKSGRLLDCQYDCDPDRGAYVDDRHSIADATR